MKRIVILVLCSMLFNAMYGSAGTVNCASDFTPVVYGGTTNKFRQTNRAVSWSEGQQMCAACFSKGLANVNSNEVNAGVANHDPNIELWIASYNGGAVTPGLQWTPSAGTIVVRADTTLRVALCDATGTPPPPTPQPPQPPVPQPVPTPVVQPVPTPVVQPVPTPVVQPVPTPVVQPVPTPVVQPVPTPVVQPVPTPVASNPECASVYVSFNVPNERYILLTSNTFTMNEGNNVCNRCFGTFLADMRRNAPPNTQPGPGVYWILTHLAIPRIFNQQTGMITANPNFNTNVRRLVLCHPPGQPPLP